MQRANSPTHTLEDFTKKLQHCGLKATAQRIAIHKAMMELGHASADAVIAWLNENSDVRITQASVYNTLSQMVEMGIYSFRMSANNKMYFDINTSRHFHVYDCENHLFKDYINEKLYEQIIQTIGQKRFKGYNLTDIDIQFVVRPTKKRRKL